MSRKTGDYDHRVEVRRFPLREALELTELGAQMRAQRHRRENPDASEDEIAEVVRRWMVDRPGAPHGDACGAAVDLSRFT